MPTAAPTPPAIAPERPADATEGASPIQALLDLLRASMASPVAAEVKRFDIPFSDVTLHLIRGSTEQAVWIEVDRLTAGIDCGDVRIQSPKRDIGRGWYGFVATRHWGLP